MQASASLSDGSSGGGHRSLEHKDLKRRDLAGPSWSAEHEVHAGERESIVQHGVRAGERVSTVHQGTKIGAAELRTSPTFRPTAARLSGEGVTERGIARRGDELRASSRETDTGRTRDRITTTRTRPRVPQADLRLQVSPTRFGSTVHLTGAGKARPHERTPAVTHRLDSRLGGKWADCAIRPDLENANRRRPRAAGPR